MSEIQHVIPRPGHNVPDRPYKTPDERWAEVVEEIYGSAELPQTIRHEHDADWDRRFLSIQSAHDQFATIAEFLPMAVTPTKRRSTFGFWSVVGLLMIGGDLLWVWIRFH